MTDTPKRGLFQLQLRTCFFLMITASLLLFMDIYLYSNGYLIFEMRSWIVFIWFNFMSLLSGAVLSETLLHKQPAKKLSNTAPPNSDGDGAP